jgi:hypothetical protein
MLLLYLLVAFFCGVVVVRITKESRSGVYVVVSAASIVATTSVDMPVSDRPTGYFLG